MSTVVYKSRFFVLRTELSFRAGTEGDINAGRARERTQNILFEENGRKTDTLKYLAFPSSSAALLCALKGEATVKLAYKMHFQIKKPNNTTNPKLGPKALLNHVLEGVTFPVNLAYCFLGEVVATLLAVLLLRYIAS